MARAPVEAKPLATSLALQATGVSIGLIWATHEGVWTDLLGLAPMWWLVPLGVGGWIVMAAPGFAASRMGVGATLAVSVSAQLVAALAIDYAGGTTQPNGRSVLGSSLVLIGAVLVGAAN